MFDCTRYALLKMCLNIFIVAYNLKNFGAYQRGQNVQDNWLLSNCAKILWIFNIQANLFINKNRNSTFPNSRDRFFIPAFRKVFRAESLRWDTV